MRYGFLLSISALMALSACGGHSVFENSMQISDEAKHKMFKAPAEVLPPTTPPAIKDLNDYSVYRLVEAKFGADVHALSVSATIKIESSAGVEIVDLVGALRADGTSSLVDLNPLPDAKNRLVAEAMCADIGVCQQIILNVYYNVEGKTKKVQFSSESLRPEDAASSAGSSGANAPQTPKDEAPVKAEVADEAEDELHPTERDLPSETDDSDERLGDFVGAPRNEILVGKLWARSKTPELPPVLSRADDPQAGVQATPVEKPHSTKISEAPAAGSDARMTLSAPVAPTAKSAPAAQAPPAKEPAEEAPKAAATTKPTAKPTPKPSAETQGFVSRWWTRVRDWLTPTPKPAPSAKPAATAKPVAKPAAGKPTRPPQQPKPPQQPDPTRPKPTPQPAPQKPPRQEKPAPAPTAAPTPAPTPTPTPAPSATVYPFPPATPNPADAELDQRITLLEAKLAPLINLKDGGVARGGYSDSVGRGIRSSIVNASLLPSNIPGLVPVAINKSAHYGSGMLVSFLENVATYLMRQLGIKLYVGDMSLKNGGSYGRSSNHNTHRNGLDADLAWIGSSAPLRSSALNDKGTVVSGFDYETTWNFLKLAARQELVQDAQKTTAVSRIFMSPAVKVGFCSWAKQNDLFKDNSQAELMRLVRPVAGHHKHFHLSLKCSPHYPLCRNLAGPPPAGTGCK